MSASFSSSGRKPPPPPKPLEVVSELLRQAQRTGDAAPIRHQFVQSRTPTGGSAGPLAGFMRAGAHRALRQYLLLVALASSEPYSVGRASIIWARALDFGAPASAASAVSKNWHWLASANLIQPGRHGRLSAPLLLREDGSGDPYLPPDGKTTAERYLRLPFDFWRKDWCRRLTLAETAMLLIALHLKAGFSLPATRTTEWYGISQDSAERGLRGLRRHDLLRVEVQWKATSLVENFWAEDRRYWLLPPFGDGKPT